jgi:PHP domain-containing protein
MEHVEIAHTLNAYADLLDIQGENPSLVTLDDIRGDLQLHSTWSDGSHTIEEMARACQRRGYEYCAITDHSKSTRIAGGLDIHAFTRQWDEMARVRQLPPVCRNPSSPLLPLETNVQFFAMRQMKRGSLKLRR